MQRIKRYDVHTASMGGWNDTTIVSIRELEQMEIAFNSAEIEANSLEVHKLRSIIAALESELAKEREARERAEKLSDTCPACNGTGGEKWLEQDGTENGKACSYCNGSGLMPTVEWLRKMDVDACRKAEKLFNAFRQIDYLKSKIREKHKDIEYALQRHDNTKRWSKLWKQAAKMYRARTRFYMFGNNTRGESCDDLRARIEELESELEKEREALREVCEAYLGVHTNSDKEMLMFGGRGYGKSVFFDSIYGKTELAAAHLKRLEGK
jgi:septal ring factor EnvC (AmiA/AmiB activator)